MSSQEINLEDARLPHLPFCGGKQTECEYLFYFHLTLMKTNKVCLGEFYVMINNLSISLVLTTFWQLTLFARPFSHWEVHVGMRLYIVHRT